MALYDNTDVKRIAVEPVYEGELPPVKKCPYEDDINRLIHSPAFRRLQGKTQLFPGIESDFFRNRLTHSLEVAQIAEQIATKLNKEHNINISVPLVRCAALAHDLGHPPFGHVGERALNCLMASHGGFEGNAQTIRILSKLEKKVIDMGDVHKSEKDDIRPITTRGRDCRSGLNWTSRTLASVLKYDRSIPLVHDPSKGRKKKGVYWTEEEVRMTIRKNVHPTLVRSKELRVIECSIMDTADDISYSVYDMEDIIKAGFLSPIEIVSADKMLLERVATEVRAEMGIASRKDFSHEDVRRCLIDIFSPVVDMYAFNKRYLDQQKGPGRKKRASKSTSDHVSAEDFIAMIALFSYDVSDQLAKNGYQRTLFISELVQEFINAAKLNKRLSGSPKLWSVSMDSSIRLKVEVLKHFAFQSIVTSPRLRVVEYRAERMVEDLFCTVRDRPQLMPTDFQDIYYSMKDKDKRTQDNLRLRVVCDFIAGMTDRFAVEFYGRIRSERPESMFKPFF